MHTRIDKVAEAAGDSLPAYTEAPPYSEAEPEAGSSRSAAAVLLPPPPPDYQQASLTPYVAIPTTLHGVRRPTRRGLHLCADADERTPRFYAAHHAGGVRGGNSLLGTRPGVHLHNGLDAAAPVLAAAGHRSQALTMHEFLRELTSVVLLPPVPTAAAAAAAGRGVVQRSSGYASILMEPSGATTDAGPVFQLKFDVGADDAADRLRPAKFAWCRRGGGRFQLVRKVFSHGEHRFSTGARCVFPKTEEEEELAVEEEAELDDGEVVADLTCGSALKAWGRLFTLELRGSAAAGRLGTRCVVMVVVTALRLQQMHAQGKTSRTFLGLVGAGEKSRSGGRPAAPAAPDRVGVVVVVDSATVMTMLR